MAHPARCGRVSCLLVAMEKRECIWRSATYMAKNSFWDYRGSWFCRSISQVAPHAKMCEAQGTVSRETVPCLLFIKMNGIQSSPGCQNHVRSSAAGIDPIICQHSGRQKQYKTCWCFMYATKILYIVIFFISLLLHKPRDSFLNPYFFTELHTLFWMHIYRKYTNFLQKYDVNFKKNSTYNLIFKDGENKIYSIYNFFH